MHELNLTFSRNVQNKTLGLKRIIGKQKCCIGGGIWDKSVIVWSGF